jgi:phosphatidylglycerol:prolipoprotein diacylglycerol transferase
MSIYGLIIGISLVIGINYFSAHNQVIPQKKLTAFLIFLLLFSLLGARIYHVFDYWSFYSQNPSQILNTRGGGMAIYGGLIGGFIFVLFFSLRHKIKLLSITDQITPILPLSQAIGRLGNFFNKENPLWWPEAILNILLFITINSTQKKYSPTGIYLIGYGLIRLATEIFRTDTWEIGGIKIALLISVLSILIGKIILIRQRHKNW